MADTRPDKRIKLSGTLPAEDRENGLDHLADLIVNDPEGVLVFAFVVLDTKAVTHDVPSGTDVPLMRIREVEAIALDAVPDAVMDAFKQLRLDRRGAEAEQDELPPDPLDDYLVDSEYSQDEDAARDGNVTPMFSDGR